MNQDAYQVTAPLLNPNEPGARVVSLLVQEGQYVSKDSVLCILETTKSTAEVIAELDGYIAALQVSENDFIQAGSIICFLANTQNWQPGLAGSESFSKASTSEELNSHIPAGLRISQPALKLAREKNLDLTLLPIGPLVTEKMILDVSGASVSMNTLDTAINPRELVVYGGGGHGKSLIELIRTQSIYHIHGVVDDGLKPGDKILGIPILGGSEVFHDLFDQGIRQAVNAVGGIGDIRSRVKVFHLIAENQFTCPVVIHPSAVIEMSAEIDPGVQVFSQAYIGSESQIGFGVIINTGAVVSHDCTLGDFVNLSPGVLLAGGVTIGKETLIGMGVTINLEVTIGKNVRIGNSATIKADVPDNSLVKAGTIWPE
ncbi:MAG: NeuD/PglB/VioB family sugar acetyltransferase [Anaerolineales bacterium]|jgi:sugar O-acyltransferase (sialic acid O-acetyltransferase NeuD family)